MGKRRSNSPVWEPTQFVELVDGPFDTSMGTARVKTDATYGYLKAMGNREGVHPLACELVATALAGWFGLNVAEFAILELEEIDCYALPRGAKTEAGPAFVSKAVPGHTWGGGVEELESLENKVDITRLVVFDTWVRNCDRHPPVSLGRWKPNFGNVFLADTDRPDRLQLYAIDHTHCFTFGKELSTHIADIGTVRDDWVYGLFPEFCSFIDEIQLAWCKAMLQSLEASAVQDIVARIPGKWDVKDSVRTALVRFIVDRARYLADKMEAGWGKQELIAQQE